MFNDKVSKSKKRLSAFIAGTTLIALAVSFAVTTVADAQIQASVSKPVMRSQHVGDDMVELTEYVSLMNGNQKISVSLRDTDLKPALRMIADKAGLNIIFHNSVDGKVTLDLVNVTLNDAFKMIMQACELSYVIDNGTLIVMSKSASLKSDISKQNMMTIPVKYADSAKLADFLNTNVFSTNRPGLSNNKIVVTNPVTNELVIFGTMNDYKMAQKIVNRLDVAPKTISFRVNHTTPKEMATLICQSLFPTAKQENESSSCSKNSTGGAKNQSLQGLITGGASSSDSGSDSSSSSGSSDFLNASSGEVETISLGEGKVACTLKGQVNESDNSNDKSQGNKDTQGALKSLAGSSLTVTYFPQKGTINITGGSDYQAEMIKKFIEANDTKQPQAYVEVQVVDLNEEGSKEFNNEWTILTPFFAAQFDSSGHTRHFENARTFFSGRPYTLTEGSASKDYLRYHGHKTVAWAIDYLIQNNKARLLANPKVVVTNGKKSVIKLTQDYVKKIDEEIMTSSIGTIGSGITREYEIADDMGIIIELTPFISPDGYITINLKPSYSTEAGAEYSISALNDEKFRAATLLKRRTLDLSNIRIKDGETLVLGGMVQEHEQKLVQKVPFLGDLPVIGGVFKNTHTTNIKSELVIMVTPRIIKDTEDALAEADNL